MESRKALPAHICHKAPLEESLIRLGIHGGGGEQFITIPSDSRGVPSDLAVISYTFKRSQLSVNEEET